MTPPLSEPTPAEPTPAEPTPAEPTASAARPDKVQTSARFDEDVRRRLLAAVAAGGSTLTGFIEAAVADLGNRLLSSLPSAATGVPDDEAARGGESGRGETGRGEAAALVGRLNAFRRRVRRIPVEGAQAADAGRLTDRTSVPDGRSRRSVGPAYTDKTESSVRLCAFVWARAARAVAAGGSTRTGFVEQAVGDLANRLLAEAGDAGGRGEQARRALCDRLREFRRRVRGPDAAV